MNEELSGTSGTTGSYSEPYQRMFTPMAGSAGHGDGHHVIPPYRLAPFPLASSGFPVTAPVLPPSSTARHLLPPSVTQQQQQQQQPAHWVLGSNSDTPMQQLQQQQQQNSVQFQRLKVEDALSYLDKVKAQFGGQPQVYNDFLDIMKEFKSQAIDTPVVISRVSNLFAGQKELIVGFNTFLPPGFKIIEEDSGQTLGLCQPGQKVVPISSLAAHANNPPFRSSEQPPVRPVPPPVIPVSQHQSHLGSQLQPPPGQPVEFNHAINYVNKIKLYYNGRPEVYKAFLDILHNYQREQKNIKDSGKGQSSKSTVTEADVYAQVASLFQDNPELLSEFRQFLPDANGNAGLMNGLGAAESAFGGGLGPATAGVIIESVGRPADHSVVAKSFNPIHRSQSIGSSHAVPPAKKRRISKDPVMTPVKSEVPLSDREYFDQLKRTMSHDDMYKEMFNCINLYNRGSISAEDLLVMTGPLISKAPELKSRLISLVESDRRPTSEKKDRELHWHLDLSSCKRYDDQPSYRILPKKKNLLKSDNRTKDGADVQDVLNEEYAVFADPDAKRESITWHFGKLSTYDETLLQIEEERYELDMVMQPHLDLMNGLTEVYQAMQKTSPEEQAKFVINDLSAHCNVSEVHIQRVLKKLYNNRWDTLYEGLKKIPSVAIPVALNRLQEKCAEWDDSKKKFNQSWQEALLKQRIRFLEQQASKFKNSDSKQLKPKTLVKEIEDLAKARESLANEPHMTLPFQDPSVLYDAVKLISLVSKRQTGITEEEAWRFKWILQSVLENILRVPYIKQEIDADEVTSSEGRNNSGGNGRNTSKSTRQASAGHESSATQAQQLDSLASQDDTVTVFYCSDSWYALLRVFMVLCDRLAFFVKHSEDLVDDERREFSQVWPMSIATTLEQHMQEHNHARKSYPTFLWLTQNLLNGALDLGIYEELIRETFGLEAYVAFTIDKLIQSIVRQILQVVASSDCVDLLKLFEKLQQSRCQSDAELAEYLTLAELIVQEENCYQLKSIKKGSKGRMTISLLPRAASRTPRPVGGAGSKEWQRASPAPSEEKPLASAKSSSGFSTTSNTALESNSRISKSPLVWASLPSPMTKKPVFLSRNLHKSPGQSLEVSRPKGAKEPIDKSASTMEEEEDDDEDDDDEDMEDDEDDCDGSRSWVDQFGKDFLIMRLTSLVQAKKTHKNQSLKKFSRFSIWLNNWKSRNVTEKNEEACRDWLNGQLEEMCGKTVRRLEGSGSQLPYHSYVKYSVEADGCANSSGAT